ncbi:MAG: hypothetical protein GDA68_17640 [Nitrospira sp. CR2.1]|nr:hypothetical protein [Nitrospira sp. CR2.1]
MDIPAALENLIREGQVVLILGAGASMSAEDAKGNPPPNGRRLAEMISDRFLGGKFKSYPLAQIAEYAISETNLVSVQQFLRSVLVDLRPSRAHYLLPTFIWTGLATTNYDTLIEIAYENTAARLQNPKPFIENGDKIDTALHDPKSIKLLKLHGCITRITNVACPLILSTDQYVQHRAGRSRIFNQLQDWAYEHPLVFIGHSLQDPDLRATLLEISSLGEARPRSYTVVPNMDEIERRFWETKKITALQGSFEEFVSNLDSKITKTFRGLALFVDRKEQPIAENFKVHGRTMSSATEQFLDVDVEYVKGIKGLQNIPPTQFYRGKEPNWSSIEQKLDVDRHLEDTILSDYFLVEESRHKNETELVVVKGHAGSGKSTLLRRIAWEGANTYGKICLFLQRNGGINVPALQELIGLCKERVYLFIDDAGDHAREIELLHKKIGPEGRLLTVIMTERFNEWNISCSNLLPFLNQQYELGYLSHKEIDSLLLLLEKHKALGTLAGAKPDQQREAFAERAGRQLLVALHEATLGRRFEDIIEDEYYHIVPVEAQQLYLTICTLNRLNAPVRAGIVSRVHGIAFNDFKERFFGPLEHVVIAQKDHITKDYVYTARHPHIAEIVFERILRQQDDRYDVYIRCLRELNIDYSSDRRAFRSMVRARTLLELFPSQELAIKVFEKAFVVAGEDPYLLHQRGIYEMNKTNGSLKIAEDYFSRATKLAHHDLALAIKHSCAELKLRGAELARTPLEREKFLSEANDIGRSLKNAQEGESYAYHALAKVGIRRLEDLSKLPDAAEAAVESLVKDIEKNLTDGLQLYPDNHHLLELESQLAALLNDSTRVREALEKAFKGNPRSTFLAMRLAQYYKSQSNVAKSKEILQKALESNPGERRLHYAYAKILIEDGCTDNDVLIYHLKRSFSEGDRNLHAQLLFARQLFITGQIDESKAVFDRLSKARVSFDIKGSVFYPLDQTFVGYVVRMEPSYFFISRDGINDRIFVHRYSIDEALWNQLTVGTRVSFKIGFAFRGPRAIDLKLTTGEIH